MVMGLAGGLGIAGAKKLLRKKKGKKAKPILGRRRVRRIVFSERQWMFVQQLVRMAGHRAPGFPHRRRRRRRPF